MLFLLSSHCCCCHFFFFFSSAHLFFTSLLTDIDADESTRLVTSLGSMFISPKDVTNVVFFGDSVSSQLAQALVCDLLRSGTKQMHSMCTTCMYTIA